MKFLTTILLIAQTAFAAPKLQNADFMSAAQIQAAGGATSQLLNDDKVWSTVMVDQLSNSLTTGQVHSVKSPSVFGQFVTPANPPVGQNKLYFKADNLLYSLDSAGVETQIGSGSTPSGTPLTFAGFDGAGTLYTIPGWAIGANNGVTASHTIVATPGTIDKLYGFESEINPAVETSDYNANIFTVDSHFDRTGSGNNLNNNLNTLQLSTSHEGVGHVNTMSSLNSNSIYGAGVSGSLDTGYFLNGSSFVNDNFELNQLYGINHNANVNTNGHVTDYVGIGMSLSGNITGTAVAFQHNTTSNITGSYFGLNTGLTGDVGTNYQGAFHSFTGNAQGYSGVHVSHTSGNITGTAEGFRSAFSNGSYAGKIASTAIMGDGVTSGGGRFFEGSRGAGSYNNWIGFNLGGGSGNTVSSETGVNISQSSGQSGSFQGVNMVANGGSGDFTGYSLAGTGGVSGTLKGIDINMSSITTTATQKIGLNINEGAILSQSVYDTANMSATPFFGQLNSIGGTFHVASGSPMTGSAFLGMNLGSLQSFDDSMGPDPFGGILGFTNVGYFSTLRVAAGKNVESISSAVAAFSNDAGSGTVGNLDGYVSAGLVSAGGTVTAITSSAFRALNGMCNQILGNCYSLRSEDNDAHLYNAGRAVLGGTYALPTETLLVNGSARVTESVYFQETAGVASAIQVQAPASLTASYTMKLPINMGLAGQVLQTDGVNQTSWTTPGIAGSSETFTLDGGVTFVNDINGIRQAESNQTIQKIVTCLHNSGTSGETYVKVNYGPALAAAVTMSVTANNGPACNSITPAISLLTGDLMNVDVTGTANGAPTDLSVKLIF